jgi:hypothetical protein
MANYTEILEQVRIEKEKENSRKDLPEKEESPAVEGRENLQTDPSASQIVNDRESLQTNSPESRLVDNRLNLQTEVSESKSVNGQENLQSVEQVNLCARVPKTWRTRVKTLAVKNEITLEKLMVDAIERYIEEKGWE